MLTFELPMLTFELPMLTFELPTFALHSAEISVFGSSKVNITQNYVDL